jgi:hypothetical protein
MSICCFSEYVEGTTLARFAVALLSVSHARRLLARVARSLLERADLLVGRARLRVAWAG